MRKIRLLGITLLALCAFGALTAVSASAAFLLAEWLVGGVLVNSELLVEISGELLLEDSKGVLGAPAMALCSLTFTGWIGPNSLGWVSEVLNLEGTIISNTPLTGESLSCAPQTGCETNTAVLAWPVGLPTETEVELLEQASGTFFVVLFLKKTGYYIDNCLILGVAEEDECVAVGESAAQLTLPTTMILEAVFSDSFTELSGLPLANCTRGGVGTGAFEGTGRFAVSGGGEPAASSETIES